MNSIFLLLLLLGCCNHSDGDCGCEEDRPCGGSNRRDRRTCDSSEREDRRTCGAPERGDCRPCGTPGQNARREENPFSPFNREQRDDQDYPPFRGNKGPCGCEDTQDA
ncbi:MAG: hypothetical protein K2N41_03035 [Lachnospiraceae bacterium]|nr:hypothetical protein [Lachnospiraceae bacterium]MDE7238668.1 hypothetical protein [Lachnospiraceae bacterium]